MPALLYLNNFKVSIEFDYLFFNIVSYVKYGKWFTIISKIFVIINYFYIPEHPPEQYEAKRGQSETGGLWFREADARLWWRAAEDDDTLLQVTGNLMYIATCFLLSLMLYSL